MNPDQYAKTAASPVYSAGSHHYLCFRSGVNLDYRLTQIYDLKTRGKMLIIKNLCRQIFHVQQLQTARIIPSLLMNISSLPQHGRETEVRQAQD